MPDVSKHVQAAFDNALARLADNGTSWNSLASHLRDKHGISEDALNEVPNYVELNNAHTDIHYWLSRNSENS